VAAAPRGAAGRLPIGRAAPSRRRIPSPAAGPTASLSPIEHATESRRRIKPRRHQSPPAWGSIAR